MPVEGDDVLQSGTHATEARKARHLDICLDDDVASMQATGQGNPNLKPEVIARSFGGSLR